MLITERDERVLEFLEELKVARASILHELFYPSYRVAARRLFALYKEGFLKRDRVPGQYEFYYYIAKPKQVKHALLVSDTYAYLHRTTTLHEFVVEPSIGDVRPDAVAAYERDGTKEIAFIEVELSNKGLNLEKYEHLYISGVWKDYFPVFPKILAVTDKRVPQTSLVVEVVQISNLRRF